MAAVKINGDNIGVILLAAGQSARLGRPKQLLLYDNRTLLQHSLQIARASAASPIVVVLGAHTKTIKREIVGVDVHVVENKEWQEGMASSIRCGIGAFSEMALGAEGVILMVCDQPFVTAALLNELIATHQKTGKPIITCSYENTFGPPVLFHHSLFEELLHLKGDVGARGIISKHAHAVEVIPFPKGMYDIDTEADYEKLKATTTNDQGQL